MFIHTKPADPELEIWDTKPISKERAVEIISDCTMEATPSDIESLRIIFPEAEIVSADPIPLSFIYPETKEEDDKCVADMRMCIGEEAILVTAITDGITFEVVRRTA